jgi:hypothetical protein
VFFRAAQNFIDNPRKYGVMRDIGECLDSSKYKDDLDLWLVEEDDDDEYEEDGFIVPDPPSDESDDEDTGSNSEVGSFSFCYRKY